MEAGTPDLIKLEDLDAAAGALTGRKHVLSILVENRPGVLARIAGLFSRRGFNIDTLAVGPTEDPDVSTGVQRRRVRPRPHCRLDIGRGGLMRRTWLIAGLAWYSGRPRVIQRRPRAVERRRRRSWRSSCTAGSMRASPACCPAPSSSGSRRRRTSSPAMQSTR